MIVELMKLPEAVRRYSMGTAVLASADGYMGHGIRTFPSGSVVPARSSGGAILGGYEAALLLRGMRTRFLRVEPTTLSKRLICQHSLGPVRPTAPALHRSL
jgi:hypothetical protein